MNVHWCMNTNLQYLGNKIIPSPPYKSTKLKIHLIICRSKHVLLVLKNISRTSVPIGVAPITHMRDKNSNIQGRSPNEKKNRFFFYHKELALFPLREVPILKSVGYAIGVTNSAR